MPRREFSKDVKRQALRRAAGFCEGVLPTGTRCDWPLSLGKFAFDHVNPDGLTGEPTLENCAVLCVACHAVKTKRDVKDIAEAKRREDAHNGIRNAPVRKIQSAVRPKPPKKHPATSRVPKLYEFRDR